MVSRPDLPNVKVGDPISLPFERLADLLRQSLTVGDNIQEDDAGIADKPPRPAGDYQRTDDAHQRIEPEPAIGSAGQQGRDGQHGSQGICQNVQIGRTKIVVASGSLVSVMVMLIV